LVRCRCPWQKSTLIQRTKFVPTNRHSKTRNPLGSHYQGSHGTVFCPTDPQFKVTFATELITTVNAPNLCGFTASSGTVVVQAVNIEGDSLTGNLAILTDSLFLGHKFPAAEQGIESAQSQVALPLDANFQQMRSSPACASGIPLHRILLTFRDFDVALVRSSLVFTMTHPALLPPVVNVPNPSVAVPAHLHPPHDRHHPPLGTRRQPGRGHRPVLPT
jgi:hypothetical protein